MVYFSLCKDVSNMGSGGGSVGRAVASDTRDLRFKSQHRQTLSTNCTLKFCRAPLRVHVSQADGRLLLWMYTLQVSLELVTNNKIVAAPSPWRLVATNWGAWFGALLWATLPFTFILAKTSSHVKDVGSIPAAGILVSRKINSEIFGNVKSNS